MKWQTKQQLKELLCELVRYPSITGTEGEIKLAQYVVDQLRTLTYFQQNRDHVQLHPTGDGRFFVTALVKKEEHVRDTVVLLSHFDVVDVQDYGNLKEMAFDAEMLTKWFYERKEQLPKDVRRDIETGEWLFGRGTMDMKCGLALHFSLIEQATEGKFNGNLLLLTVPDEEVNSIGMRAAVPVLLQLAEKYDLDYKLVLNAEPMFTRYPGDKNYYIYTGSIGKVLPGFYCYGKETHVGEPLAGLNANWMASEITNEMELNTVFCESFGQEVSPPPTNLIQMDLKEDYSVQIPHRAVTLFNLFLQKKTMDEVTSILLSLAKKAKERLEKRYVEHARRFAELEHSTPRSLSIRILTFSELKEYALQTFGEEAIKKIETQIIANKGNKDERQLTIEWVDRLAILCKDLAPMIVLFFAPPYYPAVECSDIPLIQTLVARLKRYAKEKDNVDLVQQHYFGGISDLSYVGLHQSFSSLQSLIEQMPLWNQGYSLPFEAMKKLDVPVLNVGPVGRDAHQWTERLNVPFAFEVVKDWLVQTLDEVFKPQK
jgi:arginine utilization protein RocB